MRYWKKLVAGGAAVLMSAGVARAGQEPSADGPAARGTSPARQETSWDAKGSAPSDPARARTDPAVSGAASGYVTHDELERFSREIDQRIELERNGQAPTPKFTDAG